MSSSSALSTLAGGSSSTGTLSSLGVGSGLDVNGIISKLVALDQQPLTRLQVQASATQAKISAFGQIQSLVSTLNSTISTLADSTQWQSVTATSSNSAALTATATAGATPMSLSVQVQTLASTQSTTSAAVSPAGSAVGAGTLQIQMGTWSHGSFTAGSSQPVSITVSATDTVANIAASINSVNAGVTATVVTGSSGDYLLLNGNATGAANGFQITAGSGSSTGLTQMAAGATNNSTATDAAATVNGIAVTSSTNTFANAVSGVTFTAVATTASPVNLTISADTKTMQNNVQAFVTAFNAVNDLLTQATAYDASTHTAALLQGDAPTLGLQSQLLSAVSAQFNGGGAYSHLSDIGIQVQQGGDLTLTASTLQTALSTNLTQVGAMFSSSSATGAQNGIATTMQSLTGGLLDPTKGFFTNENSSLKSDLALNSKNQAAVNTRVSAMQAQLTAKYSALDVQMAKINNLNSYISQQVAQWNKSTTVY